MAEMLDHLAFTLKTIEGNLNGPKEIVIDGENLSIVDLLRVAIDPQIKISVSDSTNKLMAENAKFLAKVVARGTIIYGISTGYGGSADVRTQNVVALQKSAIRHCNVGFGDKFQSDVVRAAMLVRANSLCKGYSGVRPEVVGTLLNMLNHDIVPVVPKRGSVSASGDLMPISYITACMMGREDAKVIHAGTERLVGDAFRLAGIEPITFHAKEGLAVLNATSFASAMGAILLYDGNIAAVLTQVAAALSVESLLGTSESFHPTTHQCMPHEGQIETARNMRHLLQDSELTIQELEMTRIDRSGVLKQDSYAVRTTPQWLAPVLETLTASVKRVVTEVNSANDNPLIDHRLEHVLHCGNFQGVSQTVAMDQARQSLQLCGKLLFAQMSEILNWKYSKGLPPNLNGSDLNLDFGFKGTDIGMAAYCSELDYLTTPLTNHVLSAEMHNQAVNSMALVSARVTESALDVLHMMLANIFRAHMQAIDLRWLQRNVEKVVSDLVDSQMLSDQYQYQVWPWYNFAFCPEETFGSLYDRLIVSKALTREEFLETQTARIASHMDVIRNPEEGPTTVASVLGRGTQKLYLFIRQTLGVKFYDGTFELDTSLATIYQAIKDRSMYPVILDMFKDIKP